jgi:hypothetical protein
MLRYARDDTHYLLYIYNTMKAALVERAGGSTQLVEEVLRASEVVALYQYVKPAFDVDGYKALLVQYPRDLTPSDEVPLRHFNISMLHYNDLISISFLQMLLRDLWQWRDALSAFKSCPTMKFCKIISRPLRGRVSPICVE